MGLNKPIHILNMDSTVRDIVNMVTIAVIDAGFEASKKK
jgi:malate dehydrogenase (oxaloacetate-decarboxylating)(NADP+)